MFASDCDDSKATTLVRRIIVVAEIWTSTATVTSGGLPGLGGEFGSAAALASDGTLFVGWRRHDKPAGFLSSKADAGAVE
eukprot:scaffold394782_cov37-Prasinocladus_malaysianus.AAC.1